MRNTHETLDVSRCEVSILSPGGAVVGRRAFCDYDDLRSWLGYWRIVTDLDTVRALDAGWYTGLKPYARHAHQDGSLRLNVLVGGCCLAPEAVGVIAADAKKARDERFNRRREPHRPGFRSGPVPGTGKRGSYCYFRREIATFGTHREAAEAPDDEYSAFTPPVRASRNAANLPSGRDDIPRNIEHSWKTTRRTQWRASR